ALGAILEDIEQRLSNSDIDSLIEEELDEVLERIHQIQLAKDRLKEASMWACRAVFQPDEKY
ncbi:Acb2/Tad1 domain-containing protein, partial [Enterobacter hormaechei]